MIDVIIPARNEAGTISAIVRTFVDHPQIGSVIVVVDADTKDHTAFHAGHAGANVVVSASAKGKGQCIREGLTFVRTRYTILCDADLKGLTFDHIDNFITDQRFVIGIPDLPVNEIVRTGIVLENPDWFMRICETWPDISGERKVPTKILRSLELHGYLTEVQINRACARKNIHPMFVYLTGLHSPFKMSPLRLEEMERDRIWGMENGILPGRNDVGT